MISYVIIMVATFKIGYKYFYTYRLPLGLSIEHFIFRKVVTVKIDFCGIRKFDVGNAG